MCLFTENATIQEKLGRKEGWETIICWIGTRWKLKRLTSLFFPLLRCFERLSNFCLKICCCFFPLHFLQKYFGNIWTDALKFKGFSLYGNLYYWDIARTFPVQESCAAFFAGTDSCLFTFSNGTKTCLFVFAGAQSAQTAKTKKVSVPFEKVKKRTCSVKKS